MSIISRSLAKRSSPSCMPTSKQAAHTYTHWNNLQCAINTPGDGGWSIHRSCRARACCTSKFHRPSTHTHTKSAHPSRSSPSKSYTPQIHTTVNMVTLNNQAWTQGGTDPARRSRPATKGGAGLLGEARSSWQEEEGYRTKRSPTSSISNL
jgi:hypothetical protein